MMGQKSRQIFTSCVAGVGLAIAVVWVLGHQVPAARAATLCVHPAGQGGCYTTIQAAVDAALSDDTINIAAGTYTENVTITGRVLTFVGEGESRTVVNANGTGRAFSTDSDIRLSDMTVCRGDLSNRGAGVNTTGNLTVTNMMIRDNHAAYNQGGGAYAGGKVWATNTVFSNNVSTSQYGYSGAGLNSVGDAILVGTSFISNSGTGSGSVGGALYVGGSLIVDGGLFERNQAKGQGGAVYCAGSLVITGASFISNTSTESFGGAIHAMGTGNRLNDVQLRDNRARRGGGLNIVNSPIVMENVVAIGNTAFESTGGAMYLGGIEEIRLTNVLFARNEASTNGAAVYLNISGEYGRTHLRHATIASPTIGSVSAIYVAGSTLNITDTIIASYAAGIGGPGTVNSDYNLFFNAPTAALTGTHSLSGTDPLFTDPTIDAYRPHPGSPAFGAGVNLGVATDLSGRTRLDPPTIGAYETAGAVYTLSVQTSTPGGSNGTVTSDPPGIDCGNTCSAQFEAGTMVTLTATPGATSTFVGWSGGVMTTANPVTITVTADLTATAVFTQADAGAYRYWFPRIYINGAY